MGAVGVVPVRARHRAAHVEVTRETVDTVTIDRHADGHHVAVTSRSDGLAGRLTVTVTSAGVRIHDTVLRT